MPEVAAAATPQRPWLGLNSYTLSTQRYFFGREAQTQELYERVCAQPLTVLYGRSGLGKTSLLGAGLLPRLKVEGRTAAMVRLRFDDEAPSLLEQVRTDLLTLLHVDIPADACSLWELAHGPMARAAIEFQRPVLIFDQFEEIFTLSRREGGRDRRAEVVELITELADLIENREPAALQARLRTERDYALSFERGISALRIVVALREDFLHELERWKKPLPALMRNRMELTELDGPSALQAVMGPASIGPSPLVEASVAAQIVRFVAGCPDDTALQDIEAVPPLLSLLCAELNEARIDAKAPLIGADQVTEQGRDILQRFYQRCFEGMPEAVRRVVEETLVDNSGKHRETSSRESVLARMLEGSGEDCAAHLDRLMDRRLLTAEVRGGAQRIELTHDLLVPLVADSRTKARIQAKEEADRKQAEAQQQEISRIRRQRWTQFVAIVMSGLALIAAFAMWQAFEQTKVARRAQQELNSNVLHAAQRAFGRAQDVMQSRDLGAYYAYLAESLGYGELPEAKASAVMALQQMAPMPLLAVMEHDGPVQTASYSPDGFRVVTVGSDNKVRVWDARTGAALGKPMSHEAFVHSVRFSADGARLITASDDHTARIWDARTGAEIGVPLPHEAAVTFAQFSADGARVWTACADGTVRSWDAQTGAALNVILRYSGVATAVSVSKDGMRVIAGSDPYTAQMRDARTGATIGAPLKHDSFLNDVQFSGNGARVVTASIDGTAQVWDARTGAALGARMRHDDVVRSAQFSADGTMIVTASDDGSARIWDAGTGAPITEPLRHAGAVGSARFSADGMRVVTASADQTVRIWDARTGALRLAPLRHEGAVNDAEFSADGARILTASDDRTARVWDARWGAALGTPLRHEGAIRSMQFSPDGNRVAIAGDDKTGRIWDVRRGVALGTPLQHEDIVLSVQFSADGERLVTGSADRTARIWNAHTGAPLGLPLQHDAAVERAQFNADATRLLTLSGGRARIWDADTRRELASPLQHDDSIHSARFSADGTRIATTNADGIAQIWNAQTGEKAGKPPIHAAGINDAKFSADGTRLVTANRDDSVQIWDARTGAVLATLRGTDDRFDSAAFSPDGAKVLARADRDVIYVWDASTGTAEREPLWRQSGVQSMQFSADSRLVLTTDTDNVVRIWDADTGDTLATPTGGRSGVVGVPVDAEDITESSSLAVRRYVSEGRRLLTDGACDGLTGRDDRKCYLESLIGLITHYRSVSNDKSDMVIDKLLPLAWLELGPIESNISFPLHEDAYLDVSPAGFMSAGVFGEAQAWEMRPAMAVPVETLSQALQALAGREVTADGRLVDMDPAAVLQWRRSALTRARDYTEFDNLIRWHLADRATRTISPLSDITVSEYIDHEIDWALAHPQCRPFFGFPDDGRSAIIDDAYSIDPAHPLILFALAVFEERSETRVLLKQLGFRRIANDTRLAARAAEILLQDDDAGNARAAAEIALSLDPSNARAKAVLVEIETGGGERSSVRELRHKSCKPIRRGRAVDGN